MKNSTLLQLETFGQNIWMDFIRRGMISSSELRQLIEQGGVSGVISNPSIFEKAIVESMIVTMRSTFFSKLSNLGLVWWTTVEPSLSIYMTV